MVAVSFWTVFICRLHCQNHFLQVSCSIIGLNDWVAASTPDWGRSLYAASVSTFTLAWHPAIVETCLTYSWFAAILLVFISVTWSSTLFSFLCSPLKAGGWTLMQLSRNRTSFKPIFDFRTGITRASFKLPASGPLVFLIVVNSLHCGDINLHVLHSTVAVMHKPCLFVQFWLQALADHSYALSHVEAHLEYQDWQWYSLLSCLLHMFQ